MPSNSLASVTSCKRIFYIKNSTKLIIMITKVSLVTLLLLLPFWSQAQSFLTQYFDGADTLPEYSIIPIIDTANTNNIWQIGSPQKILFDSSYTLPNALITDTINNYPINNQSAVKWHISGSFSFSFGGIIAIQWVQKLDLEQGKDAALVEFSLDSGTTWLNAFTDPLVYSFYGYDTANTDTINGAVGFTGVDSTWKNIWLCFDNNFMQMQTGDLQVRLTFISDSVDTQQEGWIIDNIYANRTIVHTVKKTADEEQPYLKVFPTATTGRVHIEAEKLQEFHIIEQIDLISRDGRIVQTWGTSPTKYFIDINHHSNDMYFLRIKTNKKVETIPIVLNK